MMKCIFITGTDTDSGKTLASALIINSLHSKGLLTLGFKPIASGAQVVKGHSVNEDAIKLAQASSLKAPYSLTNPYCFAPAIAPHVAAQQAGCQIQIADIRAHLNALDEWASNQTGENPIIVVEGAGGWAVPLSQTQTLSELALTERMPIILVVAMKLGCINHAMLSAQVIQAQGGQLIGWIANQTTRTEMANYADSLAYLTEHLGCPLLAEVPFIVDPDERDKWQLPNHTVERIATAIGCNLNSPATDTYANA